MSCDIVVSYDHVTTTRDVSYDHVTSTGVVSYDPVTSTGVVSYDHVSSTGVVSYDHVTTTGVVSYDLVTILTDDSKLLSPSFHKLQELANWHRHRSSPPTHIRWRNKNLLTSPQCAHQISKLPLLRL